MQSAIETILLRFCTVVFLAGLLAGCATTSETTTIQENLSILNQRQAALEARVQSAEGSSKRGGDMYARMEELQTQMRTLNGRIEQLEHKLDMLQRAQASAAQVPAPQTSTSPSVVVEEQTPPPSQPQPQPRTAPTPAPPAAEISPRTGAPPPSPAAQSKNAEQVEFDRGAQLMHQKKYEAARKEFQGFVSKYPKSNLEESALYNIGECYYLENHYEDAIKAYQQVVDRYPQGAQTASALLKEAMGWQQMGETTMARIIYTRLVEKYPGTAQAQAAEKKLQQM
jgi:tol-pal system protein YbgF